MLVCVLFLDGKLDRLRHRLWDRVSARRLSVVDGLDWLLCIDSLRQITGLTRFDLRDFHRIKSKLVQCVWRQGTPEFVPLNACR